MKKSGSLSIIFFFSAVFVLFADATINAQVPIGFMSCSKGDERCQFEGTKEVLYGDGTQASTYFKRTATNFIDCTNANFGGDPAPNVVKKCFIPYTGSPENNSDFIRCGSEGERCQFLSQRKVMFGAGNQWAITTATNGADCSVRVFTDPAPNVLKNCYFAATPIGFVPPVATQTQGMTRQQLEDEFSNSSEARQHGPSTDADFTTSLYWRYLGRGPDGNVTFHTARITNGQLTRQQLEDEFRTSPAAVQHGASTNIDFTTSLYWRHLGHGPDGNLQFHAGRLSPGQNPVSLPPAPIQSVPGSNADGQFWDAVKNSQRPQDFQSYLTAFPSGQFAALARFKINQLAPAAVIPPTTTPTSGNVSADEQFWNSVKDSQRAQDFQSYLSAFPNGQFAALARFNRDKFSTSGIPVGPTNPGTPGTVDQQFWDSVKNSTNAQDFQSYLNAFPNGQFAALAKFKLGQLAPTPTFPTNPANTGGGGNLTVDEQFWNNVKNSSSPRDFQSYLDNFPNGQFASLARFNRDRLGGVAGPVTPPTIQGQSMNASFLNRLAAENRAKLPITVGNIQLFDALSLCQSGCQRTDNNESVLIRARTPGLAKQNISIGEIEQFLKPALVKGYCGSPDEANNITMGVDVDDKFNQKIGNFFINASDCPGNGGTTATPSSTVAKPSVTKFQEVIAAAQPGSISEIARARRFFVVSNDFNVKSKISAAILNELPQMQSASTEQGADFLIGFELTDRSTGLVTANDASNPNLRGELIVFTTIPATNNRPESIRILFRVKKERNFGAFSATPDENAAKEFAKQLAKVLIP